MAAEKKFIATTDGTQTLTNKTIAAGNNTITGIGAANLAPQTAADVGKSYVVKSDGTWGLNKPNSTPDNVTIENNASDQLAVKDGGLTVAKFNTDAIASSIGTTAVATKLPTESAVKTYADGFAKTLAFTMDPSTFILSAILKDAAGTTLSTQTVDLPLETMVVSVQYDSDNKRFVITLKDGTISYIPATDILVGVVTTDATQTLTNKTIDAASNTISNIDTTMLASGVVQTTVRAPASAVDTAVPSEKAVATAVADKVKYDASSSDKAFTIGFDTTTGQYYLERQTA